MKNKRTKFSQELLKNYNLLRVGERIYRRSETGGWVQIGKVIKDKDKEFIERMEDPQVKNDSLECICVFTR